MPPSIHEFIKAEEARFETEEIQTGKNWMWNFYTHVQMIFHLKHGQFFKGENGQTTFLRAFKNIMKPILNLSYWMEDIEVKDIVFFIENTRGRVLSFFIKKYHDEVYVKEHDLDTMIDRIAESDIDYGGALVQTNSKETPEVIPLNSVAFCDQTDTLGGVIGFKYNFAPSKLLKMSKMGWGNPKNGATVTIQELVTLADFYKQNVGDENKNQSTSKNIEVYITRGDMPEHYLYDDNNMEDYCRQLQVTGFYTDKDGKRNGVTLYRKKEDDDTLLFFSSQPVYSRALGESTGESMLHPQIWENFMTIHKMNLVEAGSKNVVYTDDPNMKNKNAINDLENNEILTLDDGKRMFRAPTASPEAFAMFKDGINEWFEHAQLTGSAFDPVLGKEATSGTTFRGQERTVQQGRGMHDRRRGQRAKFIELIYRKRIIPDIVKEITGGKEFLASLTMEEMQWVSDNLATNYANKERMEDVFNGKLPRDKEELRQKFLTDFAKKGNKHLLKILKSEFEGVEVKMGINVAGKQKDLAGLSDKVLSVFQFILTQKMTNPQGFQMAMQDPGLSKALNDILEFSGISQVDFSTFANMPVPQQMQQPQQMQAPELLAQPAEPTA